MKVYMPNQDYVDAWLKLNDPAQHKTLQAFSEGVGSQRTGLSGIGNPALSGSAITGNQLQQATTNDSAFQSIINNPAGPNGQLTPKQYQEALALFQANPLSGASSVLTIARASSGFNPLSADVTGQEPKFKQYLANVSNAPFFDIPFSATTTIKQTSQNFDTLIDGIVDLYEGIDAQDKTKIKNSLVEMAKAATSRSETQQSETLFAQNSIQYASQLVMVYIYYSTITMVVQEGKSTSIQSEYQVFQARLRFYSEFWPIYAEKVMNVNYTAVGDWLNQMITPPGNAATREFCLS